mgnify:CR=1 FL=1
MYKQIAENKRRTAIIIIGFVIMIGGIAAVFAWAYNDPWIAVWTIIVAMIYAAIQYYAAGSLAMMMTGAKEIEKKDNAGVESLIRTCLLEFGGDREGTAWCDPDLGRFSEIYNKEAHKYWVAVDENDNVVAGVGIGDLPEAEGVCELQKMYCLKEYRGNGIATGLIKIAFEFARNYYSKNNDDDILEDDSAAYVFKLIGIDVNIVNQVNMSQTAYLNHTSETNAIRYFQNARILAKLKKEQLTYDEQFTDVQLRQIKSQMLLNGYVDFSKSTLELIGKNRSRNTAIMGKLRELAVNQVPTIVFACSVNHAKLLSFMLSLENIPNALVLGEMNSVDRANAISSFKDRNNPTNILINYEVLTTGFDSTNIKCVFITRPTQSIVLYSQMLGRGLRGPMMGGNAECLLVDIKDNLGRYDADMAFSHFDAYWS